MNDKKRKKIHTIHNRVLQKIKNENIQMKPKIRFVLQTILFAGGILLSLGLTLYLTSFIFFILRSNGAFFLPGFGFAGFGALFLSLPWLLIVIVLALIAILELLGRHFSFVYKRPLVYSIFGIILFVLISSVAVAFTKVHQKALEFTREHHVPIGGPLYERYSRGERPFHKGNIGTILEINENELILKNVTGGTITVSTTTETRFPRHESLNVGDHIMILGEREGTAVTAYGIRKINPEQDGIRTFDFRRQQHGSGSPKWLKF